MCCPNPELCSPRLGWRFQAVDSLGNLTTPIPRVWLHVLVVQDGWEMSSIASVFLTAGWRKRGKGALGKILELAT